MKPILAVMILALSLAAAMGPAWAEYPEPFQDESTGLWGYENPAGGEVVIPADYVLAWEFNEQGTAFAATEDDWLCINADGLVLLHPFVFDNGPDYFEHGLARFVENGRMGFFNEAGEKVIPAEYDFAFPFEDSGLAPVCTGCVLVPDGEHSTVQGGKWGCVDRKGRLVAPMEAPAPNCSR